MRYGVGNLLSECGDVDGPLSSLCGCAHILFVGNFEDKVSKKVRNGLAERGLFMFGSAFWENNALWGRVHSVRVLLRGWESDVKKRGIFFEKIFAISCADKK